MIKFKKTIVSLIVLIGFITMASAENKGLKPDLILNNVNWKISNQSDNGAEIIFCAEVLNQGERSTPEGVSICATFFVNGKRVSWSDTSKSSLKPGQSRKLWVNDGTRNKKNWFAEPGIYSLEVVIDDLFKIEEQDEDNNSGIIELDFSRKQ